MDVTGILIGAVIVAPVSGLICFLLCERRARNAVAEQTTLRQLAEARATYLQEQSGQLEKQHRDVLNAKAIAESANATLAAQLDAERSKVAEQLRFIQTSETRMREAFESLSMASLKKGGEQFLSLASERFKELTGHATASLEQKKQEMTTLLQPMTQTLSQYKESLDKLEASRAEAFTSIAARLAEVVMTQQVLGSVTTQLSSALRRTEVRGQWGEMTLRRLFEMSGLQQQVVFIEQVTVEGDDGAKLRPDVVVKLPNDREVLIDCKAVLDAFLQSTQCTDEATRRECLQRHARQVRARVDELSKKAYWTKFGASADYIVMFLPGEAFLYAAVEHDAELIEYALSSKVIIASPTTLLGLLKVIEFGWEKKLVEANSEKIRQLGVELHERVVKLSEHFEKLGAALESSVKAYNFMLGSLESRVFSTVRKIADLGAGGDGLLELGEPLSEKVRDLGSTWRSLPNAKESDPVS